MDNMDKKRQELKDKLLEASLPHIIFDGWSMKSLQAATSDLGIKEGMIYTVFVDPESELVEHFSDWADRRMIARLDKVGPRQFGLTQQGDQGSNLSKSEYL